MKNNTSTFLLSLAIVLSFQVANMRADDNRSFVDAKKGIKITCPDGWTFMSPTEVSQKTQRQMQIPPGTLVFCVNLHDFDQNINVIFAGDTTREAPTKESARTFLETFRKQAPEKLKQTPTGPQMVSSDIYDIAGGVGLEMVTEGDRGGTPMKSKQLLLISHGKGFTITCTAKKATYDEANKKGFGSVLSSIVIE